MEAPLQADKQTGTFYVILNRQWQKDPFLNIPVPIYSLDNYEYYSKIIIVKIRLSLGISGFSLIFFLPQSFKTLTLTYFFLKILI